MFRSQLVLPAVVAASLLCSCGGSSSSPPPPPPSPALEKVASVITGRGTAVDAAGNVYAMSVRTTTPNGPAIRVLAKIGPQGGSISFTDVSEGIFEVVASDAAGYIYVGGSELCHGSSGCAIPPAPVQKAAPDGTVTPLPVKGSSDGTVTTVFTVGGLAVDAQGNVYISQNIGIIERLSPAGDLVTVAGADASAGQEVDGKGTMARFAGPSGLAFDAAGNLYGADAYGKTIRKMAPDGTVTTIAGRPFIAGTADGPASTATFNYPSALAVDASGVIYVADTNNPAGADASNALIRRIDLSGNVTTVAGTRGRTGFAPGPAPGVIDPPTGLAVFGKDVYFTTDNAVGVVRNPS